MILGILFVSSCSEDDKITYNPDNVDAPLMVSPSDDDMDFTKEDADELVTFSWSKADVGFNAATNYDVEFSIDNTFEEAKRLVSTGTEEVDVKVSEINNLLISLGYAPAESGQLFVRVVASINDNVDPIISATKEYTVVAYETLIDYPMIYVPGAYQGWSPGAENGRLFSYEFNDIYEGIIRITETVDNNGEFKITEGPNWDVNYGGVLVQAGDNYSGTLDGAAGNMMVTPGTYKFTVNMADKTIELEKTDDWGIIGGAVPPYDWSVDVDLFYNGQRQMWEITTDFGEGDFKFRANDGWDFNLGSNDADGTLQSGGSNIPLPGAGNYTIRMNPDQLVYSVQEN